MDKLNEWFAGNRSALDLYERLVFLAHAYDDLIDKDKPVSDECVNSVMSNLLMHIPFNEFYLAHQYDIRPLMYTALISYRSANIMEKSGDEHAVELAHYARYSIVSVVIFMISVLNGESKTPEIVAKALPIMIPERVSDYMKEICHVSTQ